MICKICEHSSYLKTQADSLYCLNGILNLEEHKKKCNKFEIACGKEFEIIVDSREQIPFFYSKLNNPDFPNLKYVNGALKTGDYSLSGFSDPEKSKKTICIERKSLSDLYGTLGRGRERFEKEVGRMSRFSFSAIVIEADYLDIITNPPEQSKMSPKAVIRSLLAIAQRNNIHVIPCSNRSQAEKFAFIFLERFYQDHVGTFSVSGIFKPGKYFLSDE